MSLQDHTIINMGLERVFEALEILGNPQHNLPPVLHFAGTNGKGSTIAFTKQILNEAGYKCHVYTSPHLIKLNERIVLADKEISDDDLQAVIAEVDKKCKSLNLTYFEATTLAGFLAFSRCKADFLLLETGMGGRLDATNVMGQNGNPKPLATILTSVSYDHIEFLGDKIEQIAFEKANILKKGAVSIMSRQAFSKAEETIRDFANKNSTKLKCYGGSYKIMLKEDGSFEYREGRYKLPLSKPALLGEHQYYNAATAIALVRELIEQYKITEENIISGIKNAYWPARIQSIKQGIFKDSLNADDEIYLDGSHNKDGAEKLAKFAFSIKGDKKLILIFSMLLRKNPRLYLSKFENIADELIYVQTTGEESHEYGKIEDISKMFGIKSQNAENLKEVTEILNKDNSQKLVITTGSLYFAGEVLDFLQSQ